MGERRGEHHYVDTQRKERVVRVGFKRVPAERFNHAGYIETRIVSACPIPGCSGEGRFVLRNSGVNLRDPPYDAGDVAKYDGYSSTKTECPECGVIYRMTRRQHELVADEAANYLISKGIRFERKADEKK